MNLENKYDYNVWTAELLYFVIIKH